MRPFQKFLSASALAAALSLSAANWTQFRGPLGSGVAEDTQVPTQLDAKSVAWTASLPGRGLSATIGDVVSRQVTHT